MCPHNVHLNTVLVIFFFMQLLILKKSTIEERKLFGGQKEKLGGVSRNRISILQYLLQIHPVADLYSIRN